MRVHQTSPSPDLRKQNEVLLDICPMNVQNTSARHSGTASTAKGEMAELV